MTPGTGAGSAAAGHRPRAGRRFPWPARVAAFAAGLLVILVVVSSGQARSSLWADAAYATRCLAVGAAVTADPGSGRSNLETFLREDERMGPLTIRRSFDSALPSSFDRSAAAGDPEAGLHTFVSWKPPGGDHRGAAAGRYDEQVAAWARSVPDGVFATSFHEPENDMTGPEFVAFQRHLHTVVTEANPGIHWGPVYMAYWWDPARPSHYIGDPALWWPGDDHADFAGLDWYGADPEPMTSSPSFLHWYRFVEPTGLPLFITEYGQYVLRDGEQPDPALLQERVDAIRSDAAWIAEHPRIRMWLYWQGTGRRGDWRLHDEASREAWRAVAETGCHG
ncbi:hypothetical protein ABC795_03045 [Blastococcus sp. HT6-30]|uniref:hypothetical protein n=1 Tax=Blastococcus sp. HT6-30 TaxID=3144843 RepID=UPI00321A0065